jgi:hypothetical protein
MEMSNKQEKFANTPNSLRDPMYVLSAQEIDNSKKNLTVFIGIITASYPENNWNAEKEHTRELLRCVWKLRYVHKKLQ